MWVLILPVFDGVVGWVCIHPVSGEVGEWLGWWGPFIRGSTRGWGRRGGVAGGGERKKRKRVTKQRELVNLCLMLS